jgi:hypothetical protein
LDRYASTAAAIVCVELSHDYKRALWRPRAMDNDTKIPGKPILDVNLPRIKTAGDELPPPDTGRWTARRKASVVAAVLRGVIGLEEVCRRYDLSVEEFLSWHNAIERHGVQGLHTTKRQKFRYPSSPRPSRPPSTTK